MADPEPALPARVVFDDAVHPAHVHEAEPKVDCTATAQDAAISDEEWAHTIAARDLQRTRKQTYRGSTLLWLAFQSTGVIYGDIGTSPLYVFSSTFSAPPSREDVVGALSIIFWSLTLIVTVKYAFVVLAADDDGQGGTFALYALLARHVNMPGAGSPGGPAGRIERVVTNEMPPAGRSVRRFLERSAGTQRLLKVAGVVGVSMVMADGVLTPAQSVLGAVQGLRVAAPGLATPAVVGVTCGILVLLFAAQPLGTARLGTAFAPVVSAWLLFNAAAGIYNLAAHDGGAGVLRAWSPAAAFGYLARSGERGWRSLGGLLLAFTGVEALFADLGAFSQRAIQLSWLGLAYPCLLLAYAGQAAVLAADASGTAYANPFFRSVPPGTLYLSLVLAILAAVVASQAMITSAFQLLVQLMRLSYFPHIRVVHTSRRFHEQVYIPLANWLLMVGTVIVAAVYNNTTSLGNAYGVCVVSVTLLTTCMVSLVALVVWRAPALVVAPLFLVFAALDGAYLSAVLTKVPEGAWFTLLLAALCSAVFVLWRFGKEAQWRAEAQDRLPAAALLTRRPSSRNPDGALRLAAAFGHTPLATVPGLGIFFDKEGYGAGGAGARAVLPPAFAQFVRKFATRPAVLVFFHMRPLPVASVPEGERYVVTRVTAGSGDGGAGDGPLLPHCYAVVLRHGYADDVLHPDMAHDLVRAVEHAITTRRARQPDSGGGAGGQAAVEAPPSPETAAALETLREAELSQVVYVLGREQMRVGRPPRGSAARRSPLLLARQLLLGLFLWMRENSRTKLADLDINMDRVVEVGFVKEI